MSTSPPSEAQGAFRPVPRTGVIYVMTEAEKRGFKMHHPDWCNLGQGQPDTGELPGAPPRRNHIDINLAEQDYAPIAGIWELREAVADMYNNLLRRLRVGTVVLSPSPVNRGPGLANVGSFWQILMLCNSTRSDGAFNPQRRIRP